MIPAIMAQFNSFMDKIDFDFWQGICQTKGRLRYFEKGECIIKEGERSKIFGWIVSGYFKYLVCDSSGMHRVTGFAFDASPVADFIGVVTDEPAPCDVVAGVGSEVLVADIAFLREALVQNPRIDIMASHAVLHQAYHQYLNFFRQTPTERYQALLRRCPDLLQTISLKELASFLAVTPQHLCRIRRGLQV